MERFDVAVTGGTLAVWRDGAPLGTAPVVLAAHGITGNQVSWDRVRRDLGDRCTFVAADLRGRGCSSHTGEPFGMAAHAADQIAVLDHLDVEKALLLGHSMGAYVMARVAADNPERAVAAVLVDGGISLPFEPSADVDVQAIIDAVLGPAVARLKMTFPTRDAYADFFRAHPAFTGGQIDDEDLTAYVSHDSVEQGDGSIRSSVQEAAVRADGADVLVAGEAAHRIAVDAVVLRAPRGLLDQPEPLIPGDLATSWAGEDPGRRNVVDVDDVNHYSIVMGRGAATVAAAVVR